MAQVSPDFMAQAKSKDTDRLMSMLPFHSLSLSTLGGRHKVIYPISGEVPPRHAIIERNRWMVQKSDVVIFGISHNGGGAARTLEYASLNRKVVLQYPAARKGA